MNLVQFTQRPEGFVAHAVDAYAAWRAYVDHCEGNPPPRVPGCDTIIRLAWRIYHGRTIQEAAAREYLYRWHLAIKAPDQCIPFDWRSSATAASIFGAPHAIGL